MSSYASLFPYTYRTVDKKCSGEENKQFLTDICQGKEAAHDDAKRKACTCLSSLDSKKKYSDEKSTLEKKIAEYDTQLAQLSKKKDSKKIIKLWDEFYDLLYSKNKHLIDKYFYETYIAIARCGDYDYVITKGLHSPHGKGFYLIGKLNEEGLPIRNEIVKFISKKPFNFKYAEPASKNIVNYFIKDKWFNHGEAFTKLLAGSHSGVIVSGLMYLEKTNYGSAQNAVLKQLGNGSSEVRKWACNALAKIGNRKALGKLKLIAKRDPAYRTKHFKKIYFVRNAANKAIISIESR